MTFTTSTITKGNQKDAFDSIVYQVDDETGCWNVTSKTTKQGYQAICRSRDGVKRTLYAHRLMWERANGRELQPGEVVCHTCDNPNCVNPDHLWVGSARDNARDSCRKGRSGKKSLTVAQAKYIILKNTWVRGDGQRLADAFGVSNDSISQVKVGATWSWLRDDMMATGEIDLEAMTSFDLHILRERLVHAQSAYRVTYTQIPRIVMVINARLAIAAEQKKREADRPNKRKQHAARLEAAMYAGM